MTTDKSNWEDSPAWAYLMRKPVPPAPRKSYYVLRPLIITAIALAIVLLCGVTLYHW